MGKWSSYGMSVVAAAMVVAIITALFHKNNTTTVVVKMIGGLFLAFTVVQPLVTLDIANVGAYMDTFSETGADAAAMGENLAQDAYRSYIKSETESYILDKADTYGVTLDVDVELDDDGIPCYAELMGQVGPYAKTSLSDMMETDLGISKGNQRWIG